MSDAATGRSFLFCGVGSRVMAVRLDHVVETMRPLEVIPIAGTPPFVRGTSVVRGEPLPVVDAGVLLGDPPGPRGRLVSITVGARRVGLLVDAVIGIEELADEALHRIPRLLQHGPGSALAALGVIDSELLVVLEDARLVPETVWSALDGATSR